jgi:hypothetical protein
MGQTMPHVYEMSKHPKDKGYKKKTAKKKLESEMHIKYLEKVW